MVKISVAVKLILPGLVWLISVAVKLILPCVVDKCSGQASIALCG